MKMIESENPLLPRSAHACYRELLREKNVPSTSNWDQVYKLVSGDPRYDLLSTVSDRKQAFNGYKVQKQKEEREQERMRLKKAKEDLENFLQACEYMSSNIVYKKAHQMFGHLQVWVNVPERERRELFEDVVFFLEKREKDEIRQLQRSNMTNLKKIFEHLSRVGHETTWTQVQEYLLASKAFKSNANLQKMDKEDALVVFEDHIRQLQIRHDEDMERYRRLVFRSERKNREAFLDLLDELRDAKKLTCRSMWREVYPVFRSDDRFLNMVGQPGSTPLDLFKFYVDALKTRYDQDRRLIKSILRDAEFEVHPKKTDYEDFVRVVKDDKRSDRLDEDNIPLAFASCVQRAIEEERERIREQQRKQRRAETSFRRRLRHLKLKDDSQYDEFEKEIEEFEEADMFNREEREKMFCEVLLSLKEAETLMRKRKQQQSGRQVEQLLPAPSSSSADEEEEGEVARRKRKKEKKRRKKSTKSRKKSKKRRKVKRRKSTTSSAESTSEESDESSESEDLTSSSDEYNSSERDSGDKKGSTDSETESVDEGKKKKKSKKSKKASKK
ncbi:hypothetical protein ACOME3_004849 [Neoechinorhynchus agilis]